MPGSMTIAKIITDELYRNRIYEYIYCTPGHHYCNILFKMRIVTKKKKKNPGVFNYYLSKYIKFIFYNIPVVCIVYIYIHLYK